MELKEFEKLLRDSTLNDKVSLQHWVENYLFEPVGKNEESERAALLFCELRPELAKRLAETTLQLLKPRIAELREWDALEKVIAMTCGGIWGDREAEDDLITGLGMLVEGKFNSDGTLTEFGQRMIARVERERPYLKDRITALVVSGGRTTLV